MIIRARLGALLALRSLIWTLAFPGVVAGYVPWRVFGLRSVGFQPGDPIHWLGAVCTSCGVVLLGWCIWEFAKSGRGTLSPVDPPSTLVIRGLYRYVRNPMYLSVALTLLGEVLLTRSRSLLVYSMGFILLATLFVVVYEEPTLRRQFGADYDLYTREVGRWIPRMSRREWRRPPPSIRRTV